MFLKLSVFRRVKDRRALVKCLKVFGKKFRVGRDLVLLGLGEML